METCAAEVGLLSKKPCGQPAATRCANCEMALYTKHAVPQLAAGRKTGKFMCKECDAARKQFEKNVAPPEPEKKAAAPAPAAKAAPGAPPPAAAPKQQAPKPAAPPKEEDSGSIDFTPTKK